MAEEDFPLAKNIKKSVQGLFNCGTDHLPQVFFHDLSVRADDLRESPDSPPIDYLT